MTHTPADVLEFWFSDRVRAHWFSSTPELDREVRQRFEGLWRQAAQGELDAWAAEPGGCLALVIVLDQFPLNMYRGEPRCFETEARAADIARAAVDRGLDDSIEPERLTFLYMPLMHREDLADQDLAVRLFRERGLSENLKFAEHHRGLIRSFGRFPHRNAILGRESTDEERTYLASKEAFLG